MEYCTQCMEKERNKMGRSFTKKPAFTVRRRESAFTGAMWLQHRATASYSTPLKNKKDGLLHPSCQKNNHKQLNISHLFYI